MSDEALEVRLSELSRRLAVRGARAQRILAELRAHVEDSARRFTAEGLSREEAVERALEQLGSAEAIARAFERECPHRRMDAAARTLAALAAVTATASLVILGHSLLPPEIHEAAPMLLAFKLSSAGLCAWMGVLTLWTWRRRAPSSASARILGALLVVTGLASSVVVLELARATGDLEAWAIALGLAQVAQGLLTIALSGSGQARESESPALD